MSIYEVTFTASDSGQEQTASGEAAAVAAWMRAIADRIDPPKRPVRGGGIIDSAPGTTVVINETGPEVGMSAALRAAAKFAQGMPQVRS